MNALYKILIILGFFFNSQAFSQYYLGGSGDGNASDTSAYFTFCNAPYVISQSSDISSCSDNSIFMSVSCTGSELISFNWQVNYGFGWNNLIEQGIYMGTSNDTLIISNSNIGLDGYIYRCIASNQCGSDTSNSILLNVSQPFIDTLTYEICYGDTFIFNGNTYTTASFYSDTLMDINGCDSIIFTNLMVNQLPQVNITKTNITCFGISNGTATANVNSGMPPYNYIWSNGITASDITGLSASEYILTVTDSKNCMTVSTCSISEPAELIINYNITPVSTFNDGKIDLSVSGGTPPYLYNWSNGLDSQDISGLQIGTYSVTVTDFNECVNLKSFVVSNQGCSLSSITISNPVSCYGNSNGSVTLYTNGGTSPFNYFWSNGETFANLQSVSTGVYSVTVSDSGGCLTITSATVTQPEELNITENIINSTCGMSDGSASVFVTGGIAPYSYIWSTGTTSSNINNVEGAYYQLTVTDNNACSKQKTIIINNIGAPIVNLTHYDVSCFGLNNGSIISSVYGGTTPYSYLWSTGDTLSELNNLQGAINYFLTVTDSVNCKTISSVFLDEPQLLNIQYTVVDEFFGNDGSINLNVSGGTQPYTYSWNNGKTTPIIDSLTSDNYTITVTDSKNCTAIDTIFVKASPCSLIISSQTENVKCYNQNTGSINITVSNGIAPFSYFWNNNSISEDLYNLTAGSYSATVSDSIGCTTLDNFTISQPSQLAINISTISTECDSSNGIAVVIASGGTVPYSYYWSTGDSISIIQNLSANSYVLTVTDANQCEQSTIAYVNNDGSLSLSIQNVTNISCYNGTDGAIDITIVGGSSPFIYEWSNGASTQDISGIPAGTYEIAVTDSNGCVVAANIEVTQPEELISNITITNASCGNSDGSATISATGGISPYTFLWSTTDSTSMISGLLAGVYSIVVSDANGCMQMSNVAISNDNGPIVSSAIISEASCSSANGSINITISGGSFPLLYNWSDGSYNEDLSLAQSGDYNLTITDSNGCKTVDNYTVPPMLPIENPLCIVLVDSILNKNKIVWEKIQTSGISHYNLYKETTATGLYQLLTTVPYNDLSEYIDPYANPVIRPWRYRISAVDSCGNESEYSEAHKTLHLTVNLGINQTVNLIWDKYEGFPYYSYYVYRHIDTGGWQILDTLPSTVWTYVDNPGTSGKFTYVVTVAKSDSCFSTSIDKALGGPYSHSISNLDETSIPIAIAKIWAEPSFGIFIYPNPANDKINLEFDNENNKVYILKILNVTGQEVLLQDEIKTDKIIIDTKNLKHGYYILELKGEKIFRGKFVKR